MAELPEREQAHPTFDTLYTLAKKLEAGQPAHMRRYATSSEAYREKHRHYLVLAGRVAALEEEWLVLSDPVTGKDSESKVEAVGGLNVCLAQAMSHNALCAGCQAILPEAVPTMRHLGDGIETKQIPKGQGKAVPLPGVNKFPT